MTFFRYFFLTLASLLALPLAAQTPTDPVAWLKAEGNATDATSFANNGVVNGTVPYVTGKVGNAFNFTGNVANYVRIPNSASLQSSLLTVEYWVNFNSALNAVTVAKRNGSSDAWQTGIVFSGGNFLLQFVGNTSGGLFDWYSAPLSSPVGVWTHVAVTYDGSTVKGYINGSQVLTQAVALQLSSRTADIYVGNYAGTSLPLDAKLDELSIYNRALSAAEVLAIYQAGATGKTAPAPTVTSLSPNSGSTAGGTSVTLTGTNFTGATSVTFGGNAATNVSVVNSTTITATTPARTAGTASVIVTTPSGSNAANSLYTYLAPGDLDPLNPALLGSYVLATAVQPDGKLILAGKFTTVLGVARNNLARLNADGTLDTTFNPNPNGDVNAVTVQPDGKILLGGLFTNVVATTRNSIARLNADGSLDTGFNPNANGSPMSIVLQADGKVLLGGDFTTLQPNGAASATIRNRLARLNTDGSLDTAFNPNANDRVVSMALQADGKILISGYFLTLQPNGAASATTRNRIARLNADGTLDTGFNPNANNWVNSLALEPDGQILLGGDFTSLQPNGAASATTRNRIARLNADGTLDTGFDPNANGSVLGIAVQADGKVLLGGYFVALQPNGAASSTARNCIARVNADGTLDAGFDPKPNNALFGIALQADGKVLLGGLFSTLQPNGAASATPRSLFARVANDAAVSTASVPSFSQVLWTRSGSAPEVSRVTFELSTDSGASWSALGNGTRVGSTSSWQLTGLSLPASGVLRARGATTHGYFNGSSGLVENAATFLLPSAPTVTGISPASGTTAGGTSVTLTGTNFTGATAVTFGGSAATNVSVVNSTTITATTPSGTAGTAGVIVATPGGTNAANSLYTYVTPAPTVTGLSPASGTTAGGTSVTITGTNLTSATAVTFGGNAATNVTVVNSTTITATTPAGTAGTASVIVATPGGTNGVNALFAYVAVNSAPSFFLPAPNGNASQAWTATESARNWSSIASSSDGSKLVAAAFNGRIYTSTDSGVTWTPRESNRSWISVASSADGSKLAAVVIGGQIYTSADSGVTWTPRASDRFWFSITSSADGSKLAAVVYTGQIYTSTDSGATWTARENDRYWRSIDSSADGTKLVAIVESGQIYTSTNSGATWTARESNRIWWNVTSSADGSKLAAVVIGGQIYTSTDSGVSWTPRESNRNWNFIASSADGTRLAATVDGMQIFTSVDGGETWTARESNRAWTAITSSADGGKLAATAGGGNLGQIYLSPRDPYNLAVEIAPQTFSMAGFATSITPGPIGEESQTVTFDVSSDQPSLFTVPPAISSDGTLTFRLGTTPGVTTVTVIAHDSGGTALGGTDTSVPQTFTITALPAVTRVTGVSPGSGPVEGGTSVVITGTALNGATAVTFGGTAAASFTVVNHTTIHATTPAHLVGAVNVQVSAPAGTNAPNSLFTYIANTAPTFFLPYTQGDPSIPWTVRDTQRTYVAAAVSADGYKMAAVNYGGQIFTSTDSGITWVPRENSRLWRSIASSRDGTKLAAVAYGQRIYTSTDSGETWTPRDSDRNWVAITSSGSGDNLAAAVENGQIYYSSDSGATWTPREAARPYTSLDYSENGLRLAVAAYGDYLYMTHPFGYLAAISNDTSQFLSIAVSSDSVNIVAAAGGDYLYVSNGSFLVARLTDAYRSWMSVDVSGDGTKMGAVAYGDRIYLSSDSGASWTPCESNRNWSFITTATDGNGWVALADGRIYTSPRAAYTVTHPANSSANVSGFVRNVTAGPASESWQTVSFQVTNDNNALFTTQPAISSDGTLTFAAGTATGSATVTVTARDNGGTLSGGVDTSVTQTFIITLTPALPNVAPSFALRDLPAAPSAPWRLVTDVPNPSGFALSADGRRILAGTTEGLYISSDGGVTWTKHMDGLSARSVTSSADGMKLTAVSSAGGLWASVDGGASWTYRGDSNGIFALDASDDGLKLIASFTGAGTGLQTSPDGGITWVQRISGEIWNGVASSADGTKLAGVVRGGTIAISFDGGATWTRRMTDANRQWWSITSSADGTKLAAVVKGGSIYTSSDSGVTWTARLTDANRQWYHITSSADGTKLAAVVQPGFVYLSADGGLTWSTQASELYWYNIACSADGERLFAADVGYGLAYTSPRVPFTPSVAAASGPSATPAMAQYISPGPAATESGQSVAFQVTNDNNALFLTQPAISGGGTLTFTPGYLAGTATVSVVAVDNGGTAYGGTDTSAPQTFTITVTPGTSPIDLWRQAQFGNATARIGDNDDFDFDGLANLLEYGLVLSPTARSSQPAVQLTNYPDGDRLRIILQRDPARSDVTIEVQASGDLTGNWTTLATSTLGAPFAGPGYVNGDDAGPGLKTVEIRDTVKVTDAPRRFLRVKVNR